MYKHDSERGDLRKPVGLKHVCLPKWYTLLDTTLPYQREQCSEGRGVMGGNNTLLNPRLKEKFEKKWKKQVII